jgi:hypothetical protein
MTEFYCQALDFHGTMWCGRCKLNWTTGVSNAPKCKPKADPPINIPEMYSTITGQAKNITDSQAALLAAKLRTEPYPGEMRRAAVLTAAGQLLERVYKYQQIMDLLKGGKS